MVDQASRVLAGRYEVGELIGLRYDCIPERKHRGIKVIDYDSVNLTGDQQRESCSSASGVWLDVHA